MIHHQWPKKKKKTNKQTNQSLIIDIDIVSYGWK
jgi:hypothetical protein